MATAPVFLPGKSHGQRCLWATVCGVTESDVTEQQNRVSKKKTAVTYHHTTLH